MPVGLPLALGVHMALALACATPSPLPPVGQDGGQCEVPDGGSPIVVLLVKSPKKVQEYRANMPKLPVIAGDAHTLVFADGRMVTTSLERVGDWVNELGWVSRPISIQTASRWRRPLVGRG